MQIYYKNRTTFSKYSAILRISIDFDAQYQRNLKVYAPLL